MKGISTPPGMNERLLQAIQQEERPLEARQTETEQYLRRFQTRPLPPDTQGRMLAALQTVRPYRRSRRLAVAACAAVILLLCVLLYPTGERSPVLDYAPEQQPAYTVTDAAGQAEFIIKTPVVFVSDNVM